MKKLITLFFLLALSMSAFAQNVNDYKYVIVPTKFSFLKKPNQFNMNALTKSLLEKYGFVVFFDNENLPAEVGDYNCNKLYADVIEDGNFMKTKMKIVLKDCKGNPLFITDEGTSREKEYGASYNEAFRMAARSFETLHYKYNGNEIAVERTVVKTINDGTTIKKEIVAAKPETVVPPGKEVFFAQPISNGYQLVDSTPKVVMKIFNTNTKDMFIAEKGQEKGVLRNDNGQWIFDYYTDGKLNSEIVYIKF